ncbi:MAG: SEC-C domain-containing protein [Elusimicrobiaceae bacterium]|nr:SEC-C domain-containing protein [Elusimicrobiaceae bacterium]
MEADGVDMNSPSAMRKWAKANQKKIREQEYGTVKPIVKNKEPGRNDPCPCGSGKKYKKCCGANK